MPTPYETWQQVAGGDPGSFNFFGGSGTANAYNLGTGGFQGGGLESLVQQLGMMMNMPVLPSGGHYSPIGRVMFEQQQADMRDLMQGGNATDIATRTASLTRINSRLFGPTYAAQSAASEAEAITGVLSNPMTMAFIQQNPMGLGKLLEDFTGSSNGMARIAMYNATRGQGATVSQINQMGAIIGERFNVAGDPLRDPYAGQVDQSFTHGLNQREIGEAAGTFFKGFNLDPSMASDTKKFGDVIERINLLTAGLKDVFGPNAPIEQLFKNLNQITAGGVGQMSIGDMTSMVEKIKATALKTGISMEGLEALMGQSAMYAQRLGLPGTTGAAIALDSAAVVSATLTARAKNRDGPVWGDADPNQMGVIYHGEQMRMAASPTGVALGGILRMQEDLAKTGKHDKELDTLATKIRTGNITQDDLRKLEDVNAMAEKFGHLMPGGGDAGRGAAVDYLTDKTANAAPHYRDQTTAASMQMFMLHAENDVKADLESSSALRDPKLLAAARAYDKAHGIAGRGKDGRDMTQENLATRLLDAVRAAPDNPEAAAKAMEGVFSGLGMKDAQMRGIALESEIGHLQEVSTGYRYANRDFFGFGANASQKDMLEAIQRMKLREHEAQALGFGTMGGLGNRLQNIFTSPTKVTPLDAVKQLVGAPTTEDMDKILKIVGGSDAQHQGERLKAGMAHFTEASERLNDPHLSTADRDRYEKDVKAATAEIRNIMGDGVGPNGNSLAVLTTQKESAHLSKLFSESLGAAESYDGSDKAKDLAANRISQIKSFIGGTEGKAWLGSHKEMLTRRHLDGGKPMSPEELQKEMTKEIDKGLGMLRDGNDAGFAAWDKKFSASYGKLTSEDWRFNSKGEVEASRDRQGFAVTAAGEKDASFNMRDAKITANSVTVNQTGAVADSSKPTRKTPDNVPHDEHASVST